MFLSNPINRSQEKKKVRGKYDLYYAGDKKSVWPPCLLTSFAMAGRKHPMPLGAAGPGPFHPEEMTSLEFARKNAQQVMPEILLTIESLELQLQVGMG